METEHPASGTSPPAVASPSATPAPETRPPFRILAFSFALVVVAAAIASTQAETIRPTVGFFAPWWGVIALTLLFAVSELMVVHVQVGRSAHTVSVVEVAFVVALFHASPPLALVAHVVGCGLVLVVHRRQKLTKVAFNLAMFSVESQLAFAAFRALEPEPERRSIPTLSAWPSAYAATMVFTATGVVLVFAVIRLAEGGFSVEALANTLRVSFLTASIMASIGIAASTLLAVSAPAALLLALPILGAFATNQMFLRERRRVEELEFLRASSVTLLGEEVAEQALWRVLEAARTEFRAELIEYEERDRSGVQWQRTSFRREIDPAAHLVSDAVPTRLYPASATLVRTADPTDELGALLAARGLGPTAVVAPVRTRSEHEGLLIVAQPSTDVATFGPHDLRLADVLTSQLSSAGENVRLEQSVGELRRLETKLVHELQHDSLTNLLNRSAFERRVKEAIARASPSQSCALLFIDLDDFKSVNDTFGHGAGDILLRSVGERLAAVVRPHDLVSRLGGDEFAIFLDPVAHRDDAFETANRLLGAIQQPTLVTDSDVVIPGASIGLAIWAEGDTVEGMLERADAAMFQAKRRGKGQVELLDPTMTPSVRRAYELEHDLGGAASRGELDLALQSVHRFDTLEVVAYECLLRWFHPAQGMLGPDDFMATGLRPAVQHEVRRFVADQAGETIRRLVAAGYGGAVSINLSAGQTLEGSVIAELIDLMTAGRSGSPAVLVEIPEPAFQRSLDSTLRRIDEMREAGAGIVLDDLGLDRLTLGFVERLRPSQVKLSRGLLSELLVRPSARPFVRSIVELGQAVGFDVVAKGIEDPDTAGVAQALGCQLGQGYLFARPSLIDVILTSSRTVAAARSLATVSLERSTAPSETPA